MKYYIQQDIESVLEITGLSMEELARELGVTRATISNWINNRYEISHKHAHTFYDYAFDKGIRLNKIKEQLYLEDAIKGKEALLFHGAKTTLEGKLSIEKSKGHNDFGKGFYCGESLEQSAMFVAARENPSLYMMKFSPTGLKHKEYKVDQEWMMTVAYHRGKLEEYRDSNIVKKLERDSKKYDYFVAPIADNRMIEIIDSFIDGEITDIQCQHCLSATNLGRQYVFVSSKSLKQIKILERCFLCNSEKEAYLSLKQDSFNMNQDKVKLARKQYRNQGRYIEEILI